MKKQLTDYINGEVNVVQDEFIISRERNSRGGELILVNIPDFEKPMYALWNCKKEAKRHRVKRVNEFEYTVEQVKPKGTGGKNAYVMVILSELEKIEDLSIEASGLFLKLFSCIEWNTCKLIRKRDNVALTQRMIAQRFNIGTGKVKHLISQLTSANVLKYDNKEKAYFINQDLVKKGWSL